MRYCYSVFDSFALAALVDLKFYTYQRSGYQAFHAELRRSITVPGQIVVHDVQVSNRMKATLTGNPALTITPRTPALQAVSGQVPTLWKWAIQPAKPSQAGKYPVLLALEAEVKIDDEVTPRLIDTFDGSTTETITGAQRVAERR
ncbi:hypothetical protein [Paraburkholderia hospita]|uniref:hypothetical protein n=1 Tax=Paraburkholderia hospita TaxID=169430 RepID=UPI0012603745|nr:hypothetical protein [Paraburkholderia hospita]